MNGLYAQRANSEARCHSLKLCFLYRILNVLAFLPNSPVDYRPNLLDSTRSRGYTFQVPFTCTTSYYVPSLFWQTLCLWNELPIEVVPSTQFKTACYFTLYNDSLRLIIKQLKGMTIEHMPWCQSVKSCYLIITMSRKESCIFMMVLWWWTWTRNLFLWTAASFHLSNNIIMPCMYYRCWCCDQQLLSSYGKRGWAFVHQN